MSIQEIATQSNSPVSIENRVGFASRVINQVCQWSDEASELREQAKAAQEKVRSEKKTRTIFRIISPFFAFYIAGMILGLLELIGMNTDGLFAKILFVPLFVIVIILVWKIPFKMEQYKTQSEEYEREAVERDNMINATVSQYYDEISVIPEKYRYPMATNYLVELFQTGRATNLPVAFDKLEEQIHRWNMEAAAQEALACQMRQAEILQNVQRNTAVSATANTVSAIANVANFLSR